MKQYTFSEQLKILKPLWRILVVILVTQVFGGMAAAMNNVYGHVIVDFWFGGAASTFIGFGLGTLWHRFSAKDFAGDLPVIKFLGLICITLSASGFVMPLELFVAEFQRLNI